VALLTSAWLLRGHIATSSIKFAKRFARFIGCGPVLPIARSRPTEIRGARRADVFSAPPRLLPGPSAAPRRSSQSSPRAATVQKRFTQFAHFVLLTRCAMPARELQLRSAFKNRAALRDALRSSPTGAPRKIGFHGLKNAAAAVASRESSPALSGTIWRHPMPRGGFAQFSDRFKSTAFICAIVP